MNKQNIDNQIDDFIKMYISSDEDYPHLEEVNYFIKAFMKKSAEQTKMKMLDLVDVLYKSSSQDKKDKLYNSTLAFDLDNLIVPDELRDPNEVILEIFKTCPRAQNSVHFLKKELEKRGLEIVKK